MDNNQDYTGNTRPTRKELLGPRPSPLKVRKDSHKIRKPPMAPWAAAIQSQAPPQPPRQPVIIYTVSPKVIHTHPSEFLNLVQRLTGADHATSSSSSSTSSSSSVSSLYHHNTAHHVSGAISPAARLASIEMTKMHSDGKRFVGPSEGMQREINIGGNTGGGGITGVERTSVFPGILSPGPGSLPQISPNLFSPLFQDPSTNINLQHDFNVVQYGNRNFIEGNYLPSPFSTNFVSPGTMISPSSLEFLHRILDN